MADPEYVHPDELRAHWPAIRPMLVHVVDKQGEKWLPEDIFMAAMADKAGVFVSREGGEITGCIVLEKTVEWGAPVCHVWACFHLDKSRTIADYWGWLRTKAANMGCGELKFSGRRGYERALPGAKSTHTVYRYEV